MGDWDVVAAKPIDDWAVVDVKPVSSRPQQQEPQPPPQDKSFQDYAKDFNALEAVPALMAGAVNYATQVGSGYVGAATLGGAALAKKAGLTKRDPWQVASDVINYVQDKLYVNYEPEGRAGKEIAAGLSLPFEVLDAAGEQAQRYFEDKGYGLTGALVRGASNAAPLLLGLRKGYTPAQKIATIDKGVSNIVAKTVSKGVRPHFGVTRTSQDIAKYYKHATEGAKSIIENKGNLELRDMTGGVVKNKLPETVYQYAQGIHQTVKTLMDQTHGMVVEAEKTGPSNFLGTYEIRKGAANAIKGDKTYNPSKWTEIINRRIDNLIGKDTKYVTPTQAEKLIQDLNANVRNKKYKSNIVNTIDNTVLEALRPLLDKAVSNAGFEGYQALKNKQGDLLALQSDVVKRALVDARASKKGFWDQADIEAAAATTIGVMTGHAPAGLATAGAIELTKMAIKQMNNPNRAIKKMFQNVDRLVTKRQKIDAYLNWRNGESGLKPMAINRENIQNIPEHKLDSALKRLDDMANQIEAERQGELKYNRTRYEKEIADTSVETQKARADFIEQNRKRGDTPYAKSELPTKPQFELGDSGRTKMGVQPKPQPLRPDQISSTLRKGVISPNEIAKLDKEISGLLTPRADYAKSKLPGKPKVIIGDLVLDLETGMFKPRKNK